MKIRIAKLPSSKSLMCLAIIVLTIGTACSPAPDPMLDMLDTQLANLKIDNLSRTMQFVVSPVRFQQTEFEEKLAAALNRWGKSEAELMTPDTWKIDPAAAELLSQYESLQPVQKIGELSFLNTDSYLIQQRFWFDKLGKRLIANNDLAPFALYRLAAGDFEFSDEENSDPLAEVLKKLHRDISVKESEKLSVALKLFDWVIRNIHLLPDNDEPNDDQIDKLRLNDSKELAAAGVPGLGYTRFPWHTMLFSRGDYVDRAKVFMGMLDQFDIDSVMLFPEFETEDGSKQRKPWAVGVNIGRKLYLFDTKLGLPIPGFKKGTITTLSEARSNPSVLESLDLTVDESLKDNTRYWVKPEQLTNIEALVFATPESMSYRIWELENKLVGETKIKLVLNPSDVIAKMPKINGVKYGIWNVAFKTHQFRRALRDAIAESSFKDDIRDRISWYFQDELYINEFVQYRTARAKYFVGLFETIRNDGNLNAIELFYKMIYKDSKIESLANDIIFQGQLAVAQGKQSSAEFAGTIAGVQQNMRLVRRDSGYFLSQCHFDNGNFGTAANWLTTLEEIEDTARWQPAINYLRARSLEAQRDYDSAIEVYNKQESEQFHGDLIRARLLKRFAEQS